LIVGETVIMGEELAIALLLACPCRASVTRA